MVINLLVKISPYSQQTLGGLKRDSTIHLYNWKEMLHIIYTIGDNWENITNEEKHIQIVNSKIKKLGILSLGILSALIFHNKLVAMNWGL